MVGAPVLMAESMYVVGPNFIWHYYPDVNAFIPVVRTSEWLGIKTYSTP